VKGPLVSVVVPTLDAAPYLDDALESIAAQTYDAWEIVLIDGGSTDDTLVIAGGRPGVRVVRQRGTGLAEAWNEGIESARGELIAFLDSDDRWEPRKLELQVAVLAERAGVDGVVSLLQFVLEPGFGLPPGFRSELLQSARPAPVPSALLTRRGVFDRIGVFEPHLVMAADTDWFARFHDAGLCLEVLPQLLVYKRVHDHNLSLRDGATGDRELLELLRASVHRRRGEP
jgi:glycosyltransferase involved in cell wall biosynthesis